LYSVVPAGRLGELVAVGVWVGVSLGAAVLVGVSLGTVVAVAVGVAVGCVALGTTVAVGAVVSVAGTGNSADGLARVAREIGPQPMARITNQATSHRAGRVIELWCMEYPLSG
jgi:hypothetical protein